MESAGMIIHNARIVTWGHPCQLLTGQAVRIHDGRIERLDDERRLLAAHPEEEKVDGHGQILMPGNICAHTHFYGAFARGMAIPGRAPKDFPDILRKLWWPLDKALTLEDARYSALVCLVDAVRHGTTTLIDHHASPNAIDGSLDVLAEAVEASGLRAVLCYEVTDRDGAARAEAGIAENERFLKRCSNGGVAGGRVAATFGLHASLTLSDATLDLCRQAAPPGTGFHIHVAEHEADEYDSLAKSGVRVVDRLQAHGILGERTIAAHAVHIDSAEAALLRDTHTWVSHQPRSNMNNGVGAADVESLRRLGIRVALGNDGFSNAMWEEWKAAYLVQKLWRRDPRRMPGGDLVEMAVDTNAALAEVFFHGLRLGVIEPGAAADLILVDYAPTTPLTSGNLPWHIVFGFHESMITMTMVAGRVLMRDRELLSLDVEAITARSRELAEKAWERYRGFVPKDAEL
jgi:putative selenium metabolism protein SsnA